MRSGSVKTEQTEQNSTNWYEESTKFITGADVQIVNEFEIEILRFLAMNMFLEHIRPSAQGNPYPT